MILRQRNPLNRICSQLSVLAATLLFMSGLFADDPQDLDLKDTYIGAANLGGRFSFDENGVLKISGLGSGPSIPGADQYPFFYVQRPAGDFQVVARLVDFTGDENGEAGIVARTDDTPNGPMAALVYKPNNTVTWMSRLPDPSQPDKPTLIASGPNAANRTSRWFKMIREGKEIAFYQSADGKFWTMISNNSGCSVALDGPLKLGFFVSGLDSTKTPTATFDSIQIGDAHMDYKTSWVGNSLGCVPNNQHVSNNLHAMWVAPDGTCFANSAYDEGGAPGMSYRDGKGWKALQGYGWEGGRATEGSVTGDAHHVFVVSANKITMLDPAVPKFNPTSLDLTVNLANPKNGCSYISGLASNGKELFVADSLNNLIRVVTLEPVAIYQIAGTLNNRIEIAPAPVEVPTNDPRFAPAEIYQTRRCGEAVSYRIPGLTPGQTYTVRCHFAVYTDKEALTQDVVGKDTERVNVRELAGGILKATVKDFPNVPLDQDGILHFGFAGYGGAICGLEVLDATGKRVFAINCGGPTVGDFKGESPELVDRDFHFDRPGPMTFDKRGNVWIIQRGNDFPIGSGTSAKYPAAVKCYTADGTFTGRQITDVVNPRALAYDATKDQLLVGENGPDLNVRFYSGLDGTPVLDHTLGEKGGVYVGPHPGLIHDPAAGGDARFASISGVGVDAQGNLYVGGDTGGTDLRKLTPDGKLAWMLYSKMFCNTYDVDPDSDGAEIYGTYNHLHLDLSQTAPGSEQSFVSYNWNPKYGPPIREGSSQAIVRRLGKDKRLVMFTSAQGGIAGINIYRYDGEIAIPCGAIRDDEIWIDADGDGVEEPGEVTKMAGDGPTMSYCVEPNGDVWLGRAPGPGCTMQHYFFKGFSDKGVPRYSGVKGEGYEETPFPDEGGKINPWGMGCKLDYDAARDIMVLVYPAAPRKGDADLDPPYFMARYDNWSKGNRTASWKVKAFSQKANPEYCMYELGTPYNCMDGIMGFQLVGDYIFLAHQYGEIEAFDLNTGQLAETFPMGPEVDGGSAWEDAAMGLRAFQRHNGEYLIFTENSGWGGKNNFIRWKPAAQTAHAQ